MYNKKLQLCFNCYENFDGLAICMKFFYFVANGNAKNRRHTLILATSNDAIAKVMLISIKRVDAIQHMITYFHF